MKTSSTRIAGLGTTIFAEMSALAARTGAVNLGQGFPDTDGPDEVIDRAVDALRSGRNQYAPGTGVPELRAAIDEHYVEAGTACNGQPIYLLRGVDRPEVAPDCS